MTVKAQQVTTFNSMFQASIENSTQPEGFTLLRREAFEVFAEKGLPTIGDEEWKYTDVRELANEEWRLGERQELGDEQLPLGDGLRLVFVDGVLVEAHSKIEGLPYGVIAESFAGSHENGVFKSSFSKAVLTDFNSFTALNTAFAGQGAFIYVPKNVKVEEPIYVIHVGRNETANFPRILFVGDEGSEAELVEIYTRMDDSRYFTNAVTEVVLKPNARLIHTRVQRESHNAFHIGTSKALLERDSVYDTTNINLGAKLARHDANLEFIGEGAEAWVDGLYLVEDGQHMDTHSRLDHSVKNCTSHQNYKGILDGKSRAVFNGKVFVHEHASGTDAEQSNKNLLLSNDSRVDTKPQLEIFNDDVKCAHGATVGQLEEEELFYLLSRGLDEDLAKNLLTYGFAEEIINKITISSIKEQLDEAVLNRLQARLG